MGVCIGSLTHPGPGPFPLGRGFASRSAVEIKFDGDDFIVLRNALERFSRRGVPHAARNALNATAFELRKEWQRQIERSMVLRNKWTTRSIRVTKARGTNMVQMAAVVGSVADYMAIQEDGGVERKSGRYGVSVPTPVASGEGREAKPRRRLVRRPNRLPNIQLASRPTTVPRKQRNAIAIAQAISSGRRYVFLELEKRRGIFRIAGGKRKPRLDMIWDLTRPSVRIPSTRTLGKSMDRVPAIAPPLVRKALIDQIEFGLAHLRR